MKLFIIFMLQNSSVLQEAVTKKSCFKFEQRVIFTPPVTIG